MSRSAPVCNARRQASRTAAVLRRPDVRRRCVCLALTTATYFGGIEYWLECRSRPANFACPVLDWQIGCVTAMGKASAISQLGQLSLSSLWGR